MSVEHGTAPEHESTAELVQKSHNWVEAQIKINGQLGETIRVNLNYQKDIEPLLSDDTLDSMMQLAEEGKDVE